MSWIDKIQNDKFSIKTGDGKEYFPLWINSEKSKEYNTTIYDFINVNKSFVERKQPKSSKYPLTFYFQGENNIEQAEEFEKSADDKRYWTVNHPFYGIIKGQPLSISRNDKNYNVTEINIDFWESIVLDLPKSNFSIKDNTLEKKENVLNASSLSYSTKNVFESSDIQKNKESINVTASKLEVIQTNETNTDFINTVQKGLKASDNLLTDVKNAIDTANEILNFPSTIDTSVKNRLNAYKNVYNSFNKILETISDKLFFQSQAAACIASYCNASVNYTFGSDYVTINQVESVITDLLEIYNDYLLILDNNSVSTYDVENYFQPDALLQSDLNDLVLYTIGNLYNLSFEAQQERIVYLSKDTNFILLAHKYLGLDVNDTNLNNFRETNNIKLLELFRLKKGREIKYYV